MRGHESILRMRSEGVKPSMVFINDWPCDTRWFETGEHATVCTHTDPIGLLDLRFLAGLRVSVSASTEQRAKLLFEACKDAGVAMVGAVHVMENKPGWLQDGWTAVWHKEVAHG